VLRILHAGFSRRGRLRKQGAGIGPQIRPSFSPKLPAKVALHDSIQEHDVRSAARAQCCAASHPRDYPGDDPQQQWPNEQTQEHDEAVKQVRRLRLNREHLGLAVMAEVGTVTVRHGAKSFVRISWRNAF
jgi:hypothetical protein